MGRTNEGQSGVQDTPDHLCLCGVGQEHCDSEGRTYYYSTSLQQSTWDHPMDEQFREMMASSVQMQSGSGGADGCMLQVPSHNPYIATLHL